MTIQNAVSALALLAFLALPAAPAASSDLARHLALDRSEPEAEAVVAAPEAIRLWFTQEPQEGSTSIRLVDATGELVATSEAVQSGDDVRLFSIAVSESPLASGSYTVVWRAMAADGHVVNEEFGFTVEGSDE